MREKLGMNSFLVGFLIFLIGLYIFPESTKVFVIVSFIFLLFSFIFRGKYVIHKYMILPWIIYILWSFISMPFSSSTFRDAMEIIFCILIFLLLIGVDYNEEFTKKIIK